MNIKEGLHIVSLGHYAPSNVVTNDDLSKIVDTNDEWISSRTGIRQRHFVENETGIDLAYNAAKMAIDKGNIDVADIGACILATVRADYVTPAMACMLQQKLGLNTDIPCFDLNAACSGFMYGLQVARGLLMQTDKKYALVIGVETLSKILDMNDRGSCVLFGDGAGAAIVELSDEHKFYGDMGAKGDNEVLFCPNDSNADRFVTMIGSDVFKFAVSTVPKSIFTILDKAGLQPDDIDVYVCHQANKRIIESVSKKIKQPMDKFFINLDKYGNTSSASIPIALSEMMEQGLIKPGMKMICVGFGAGLTWGGAYLEW